MSGETKFEAMTIPELTYAADTRGVGGWVHPILYFPWNPVVLTEGQIDADVLSHVAHLLGLDHLRFVTVPNLVEKETRGGKDKIVRFLKDSHGLVQNRSRGAPLIVVLDWEVSAQDLRRARDAYGREGDRFVRAMPAEYCNELMGTDFKGIERFYPPRIVEEAHQAGELVVGIQPREPYSVSTDQLRRGKGALRERVLAVDAIAELKELAHVIMDIERVYRQEGPVQLRFEGIEP